MSCPSVESSFTDSLEPPPRHPRDIGPRPFTTEASSHFAAAAALTKPSETSRLPTTGMCQDEDRTEMPRAGTAEARSSAPTRQHLNGCPALMAAARLKAGLRSSSCARGEGVLQRVGAQLYWNVGQLTAAESSSPLLLKND